MTAREREIKRDVLLAGLELLELKVGGRHYRARLRNSFGLERMFVFTLTPSDVAGNRNKLSVLRRFADGRFDPRLDHGERTSAKRRTKH